MPGGSALGERAYGHRACYISRVCTELAAYGPINGRDTSFRVVAMRLTAENHRQKLAARLRLSFGFVESSALGIRQHGQARRGAKRGTSSCHVRTTWHPGTT